MPASYQQLADAGLDHSQPTRRSFNENAYATPAAIPHAMQSSLHGLNEFVYSQQQQPPLAQPFMGGAQSFSGGYYERVANQNVNVESELGYALQRPGVVPGMGNDIAAAVALQRQTSGSQLGYMAQQSPMGTSLSWNNLSSTPRSYGPTSATTGYSSGTPNSHGGLLSAFQREGQMMDNQSNTVLNNGGAAVTSLLAQQLADYSENSQQRNDPNQLPAHSTSTGNTPQNTRPDNQQLRMQHSLPTNPGIMYGSGGPMHSGSYHSGYAGYGAPPVAPSAAPSSMQYMDPRFNAQPVGLGQAYNQTGSYGDYAPQLLPQQMRMNANTLPNNNGQGQHFSNVPDQGLQGGPDQSSQHNGYFRSTHK